MSAVLCGAAAFFALFPESVKQVRGNIPRQYVNTQLGGRTRCRRRQRCISGSRHSRHIRRTVPVAARRLRSLVHLVDAGGVQLRAEAAEAYQQLQNRDSFPQLPPFLAGPVLAREGTIERS